MRSFLPRAKSFAYIKNCSLFYKQNKITNNKYRCEILKISKITSHKKAEGIVEVVNYSYTFKLVK